MKKLFVLLVALFASTAFAGGNLGDYAPSAVVYGKFTTYRPSTGAAFTLGGTPALSVYKDNSTTQSTTGVTLTADFDAVTGLNHFAIDTSADGTFYSAGSNFDIVITTGTVDSVSVVGTVVGSFTIRKGTVTGIPNATAGASGGLLIAGTNADFDVTANASFAGGVTITQSSSNTAGLSITGNGTGNGVTITSGSGATGTGLAISSAATNGTAVTLAGAGTGNGMTSTGGATGHGISAVGGATSGSGLRAVATTSGNGIIATGVGTTQAGIAATGGSTSSAGISATGGGTGSGILATSGSGATGNGITATAASTNGNGVSFTGTGTGAGALNTAGATGAGLSLVGGATSGNALQTAYTSPVGPIKGFGVIESGILQSATSTTAVLRSATSFADDLVIGSTLVITGGTGAGQSRAITDWVSSTDTATVATWTTTPDNTSTYEVWGTSASSGSGLDAAGVRSAIGLASANLDTQLSAIDDYVDTEVAAIYSRLGAPAGASIAADIAAVKSDTAAILTDTGTTLDGYIQTIDTVVDAIKVKTDQLTFGVTNQLDVNVESMNANAVCGTGDAGTPWIGCP